MRSAVGEILPPTPNYNGAIPNGRRALGSCGRSGVIEGAPRRSLAGTPIEWAFVFNFVELPLLPGGRYAWELKIDGRTEDDWRLPFSTRHALPIQLAS